MIKLHLGYGVVATAYMIGMFFLSSVPGQKSGLASQLFSNLVHIPLFAGLAFFLLMSLSGGQWNRMVSFSLYGVVGVLGGACATLDEWHQSSVAGRFASVGDFLLDCLGIAILLLVHRLGRNQVVKQEEIVDGAGSDRTSSRLFC